jgi:hypothetical protein
MTFPKPNPTTGHRNIEHEWEKLQVGMSVNGNFLPAPQVFRTTGKESTDHVLDLGLDIIDEMGRLNLESDSLTGEDPNKDLTQKTR